MSSQAALLFQAFIQFLYTVEQIYFKSQEQTNLINLEINDEHIEQWTNDSIFDPVYDRNGEQDDDDSGYSFNKEPIIQQQIQGYKLINDYLQENENIDKQQYFLMSNEINHIDIRHFYSERLNKGLYWNCSQEYSHICCVACKRIISSCDC